MASLRRATLKQLRIFEAAARNLHFGRAAAELHLSQPAVSIQLKQLETDIGLPLFEQMGRRMHLTHVGAAGRARACNALTLAGS
jgi:DNA-binding transcriptional LysR family regulator